MPRAGGDRLRSSVEMRFGEFRDVTANIGECRLRQHPARGSGIDAVRPQQLARQIHPVPPSVFGEVAQYVGELQRAPEFCCDALAGGRFLPEDPH